MVPGIELDPALLAAGFEACERYFQIANDFSSNLPLNEDTDFFVGRTQSVTLTFVNGATERVRDLVVLGGLNMRPHDISAEPVTLRCRTAFFAGHMDFVKMRIIAEGDMTFYESYPEFLQKLEAVIAHFQQQQRGV